jgi:L-threonylcarbamoyladenylate synthase
MAEISTDVSRAASLLKNGELVSIPTETVYGLAANALNGLAVAKIFEAKNRPSFDPLIVHIKNGSELQKYVTDIPRKAEQLAEKFWPGPLTLVLPKKEIIPDLTTSGLNTVGIRYPNHPVTQTLLNEIDFPLAAPSANPFGYVSPTTANHVQNQLGEKIPFILDGGACDVGLESTIVGFSKDWTVVHRLGGLTIEEIETVVGKVHLNLNVSSNPVSPGQLSTHYAPGKKVLVGYNMSELLKGRGEDRIGILTFKDAYHGKDCYVLSGSGSLHEAARNIFSCLRALDESGVDIIVAELVPDVGLGRAINDRLRRAAK